jgi:hypothetical protein
MPIQINFDSNKYIPVKSSEYPDKLFVYDISDYGRLDIQLVTENPDTKEITCYKITQNGDIDFEVKYIIPLNKLRSPVIKGP